MSPGARGRSTIGLMALLLAATGCASGDDDGGPMVDRIDDAIFALETHYQAPQDYFEISTDDERVSLIVAVDDASAAEQAFWSPDDGLVEPVRIGEGATGQTFRSRELDVDPGRVLDQVREELPESEIVDFAVVGGAGDAVSYSALVRSEQGGTLEVQLSGDGDILGVTTG